MIFKAIWNVSPIKAFTKSTYFINKLISLKVLSSKNRLQRVLPNFIKISYLVVTMSVVCTVKPCSNIIYSIHYVKLEAKLLVFHIRIKKFFCPQIQFLVFPICKFCNNMVVCFMQKQNYSARNNTAILHIPEKPCLGSYQLLICHHIFPAHSWKHIKSVVFYPAKDMTEQGQILLTLLSEAISLKFMALQNCFMKSIWAIH